MTGIVDSCPKNLTETLIASAGLGCGKDKYGNNQYLCLPNSKKTGLVEFCHDGVMGILERGYCLETTGDDLSETNCSHFLMGCPDTEVHINEMYRYPACLRISTEYQCYLADPFCGNTTWDTTTKDSAETLVTQGFSTDNGVYNITETIIQTTTLAEDNSASIGAIVGSLVAVLVTLLLLFTVVKVLRRRKLRQVKLGKAEVTGSECYMYAIETQELENILVRSEERDYDIASVLDWERPLMATVEDHFSTLTDDEVMVLFCFLCSDSGPPDFTDTEWLDMLNEIRQLIYGKENPVIREEAQQTLDRLKSRDYFWDDQDKLTRDTKGETMCRIGLKRPDIPFWYSSYNTASVYLRSQGYIRKPGEKCVSSYNRDCDTLLIRRLQMNILTHVTMEDTTIYAMIYLILNVSTKILKENKGKRKEFLMYLRRGEEAVHYEGRSLDSVDHVTWLWRYGLAARPDIVRSCIGLHPHNDIYIIDNKAYRKSSKNHQYSSNIKCLLYCLLLTEKYQLDVNEQSENSTKDKIRDRYFPDINDDGLVNLPEEITETRDGVITFISDDIRHDVMYTFVTECLLEDSDLEFFLTTASRDVISEYCRSWHYERSEEERCLYVPQYPEKMYDLFIDKLKLDIITHCTVSDIGIHETISKKLNIPEEILKWDFSARQRFVESQRDGMVNMFRARGMIVGCAGAGKTTLLRKLQRRYREDSYQPTETTFGLEVHEDLFEITDDTLQDFHVNEGEVSVTTSDQEEESVIKGILHHSSRGTKLISMTDFAGQVAYYACHQVYLSRRAFYIVVMDMSKKLHKQVRNYDADRHNPEGSLFHSWTYKDYFHFWLQSIRTYCDDRKITTNQKRTESRGSFHPVIIVASHADKVNKRKCGRNMLFYEKLEECFSENWDLTGKQDLSCLISPKRYFEVQCPNNSLTTEQEEIIERVRKCIVKTVKELPHWGEEIPLTWAKLEEVLCERKSRGDKILRKQALKDIGKTDDKTLGDVLRFLHEIGQIIYFPEENMNDVIIIDVQWFVDAFKYIITDSTHFGRKIKGTHLQLYRGLITGQEIEDIWSYTKVDISHKDDILPYMDKLGLMTEVQMQISSTSGEMFYIPSMNRTDLSGSSRKLISKGQRTSMMVFYFTKYLPHFFFFRLVANCLRKWKPLNMTIERFCKNAAFFMEEDACHYICIAVNKTSIQLQVFSPDMLTNLQTESVLKIRKIVECLIENITKTFHGKTEYKIGYYCTKRNITDENKDFFLTENEVKAVKAAHCPRHSLGRKKHPFDKNEILRYWIKTN